MKLYEECFQFLQKLANENDAIGTNSAFIKKMERLKSAFIDFNEQYIDFEEICNHLIDAIYIANPKGKTIYVNQAYLDFSGLGKEQFIGKSVYEINKEKKLYTNGVIPTVLKNKERTETVGTVIKTNKKLFITGIPIFDDLGKLKYAVALDKDIDQLEKLKEALENLKSEKETSTAELTYLRKQQVGKETLVAFSTNIIEAIETAQTIAPTDVTVLITGESGTGKEVIADTIYNASNRNKKPFIKLNCSAIPNNLLESELFGYVEGAFTGAVKHGKPGLFEIANGGVILLDEIGDMPLNLQTKLLRVIQQKEVVRIGSSKVIPLDVRIIASTNKDLLVGIKDGTFREDLYYRLNVVPIYLAPLRERLADIEALIENFLFRYNKKYSKNVIITISATKLLLSYSWPGNIRELKNVIERMVVINPTGIIDDVIVKRVLGVGINETTQNVYIKNADFNLKQAVESFEKDIIIKAVEQNSSKRKAATALGIDHSTLIKKCQRYGI
jgi:PAS domain S-box-containing protein